MSQMRLPPPDAPACLLRAYPSSQKGGTLIDETVDDRASHERRLCDPDGYRPAVCPSCDHGVLHVHDYVGRRLYAQPGWPSTTVVRYLCAGCGATWRILPLLIARFLRRTWPVVEAAMEVAADASSVPPGPAVPARTRRRWAARLACGARLLAQVLATSGAAVLAAVAQTVGLLGTRAELVTAYAAHAVVPSGRRLSEVAALVHRLVPGIRLM